MWDVPEVIQVDSSISLVVHWIYEFMTVVGLSSGGRCCQSEVFSKVTHVSVFIIDIFGWSGLNVVANFADSCLYLGIEFFQAHSHGHILAFPEDNALGCVEIL